jgi:hypothetical protein
MPAIGAMDPADLAAKACAELVFLVQLEQPQQVAPHPRYAGSGGYPVLHWDLQLARFHAGEEIDASLESIYHWDLHLELFLPDWQWAMDNDRWGQSSEPCHIHHSMARIFYR